MAIGLWKEAGSILLSDACKDVCLSSVYVALISGKVRGSIPLAWQRTIKKNAQRDGIPADLRCSSAKYATFFRYHFHPYSKAAPHSVCSPDYSYIKCEVARSKEWICMNALPRHEAVELCGTRWYVLRAHPLQVIKMIIFRSDRLDQVVVNEIDGQRT